MGLLEADCHYSQECHIIRDSPFRLTLCVQQDPNGLDYSLPPIFGSRQHSLAPAWDKVSAMDTQGEYVLSSSWPSAKLLSSCPRDI
jgi:hypothetical protein